MHVRSDQVQGGGDRYTPHPPNGNDWEILQPNPFDVPPDALIRQWRVDIELSAPPDAQSMRA
jgi:hypothetical protein